jgi:stage II sporulation protein D
MKGHMLGRMSAFLCLLLNAWMLVNLGCTPWARVPQPPEPEVQPVLRVGLIQDMDRVSFSCSPGFRVVDHQGQIVFSSSSGGGDHWSVRLKFGQPASMVYLLVLYEEKQLAQASARADELKSLNVQPKILEVGQRLQLGTRVLNDNRKYWVTIGPFATEEEARAPREVVPSGSWHRVIPDISSPPLGVLDLVSPSGQVIFSSGEPFVLEPTDPHGGRFSLQQVPVGRGFSWERQEDRSYRGKLEFRIGNDGKVLAINVLSLESYLQGVLPKEMSPGFPEEALRSQAIAARSYTIAKLGFQHRLDPFDLCGDVHCQAYAGAGREHAATNLAVDETIGRVLIHDGEVVEAMYSAVCGGHTESSSNVWSGPPIAYLTGRLDALPEEARNLPHPLDSEEMVGAWVASTPPVFCNHLSEEAPTALHYTRRHFRWIFTHSRQELEGVILEKTGKEIGTLLDIIPLQRGLSGRLMKVLIVGDADEMVVERELNIRRALSSSHLPSACFVVDKEMGLDGLPATFVIRGAGWGHGVGMCQAGAAGMAIRGMGHGDILSHYYQGAQVTQIYGLLF